MTPSKPLKLADTLLDRTLIGYTSIGYSLRRAWWPPNPPIGALEGTCAIVTGAKSGLGKAAAIGLARLGATVRIAVRGREAGETSAREIERAAPGATVLVDECDVSLLSEVREYASRIDSPVHVLVHNAGVMPPERRETAEGNEAMLATHVLGPHLMTALLQPALAAADHASVVWVSSGGMYGQRLRLDDLQYRDEPYRPATGYARTKRMQVVLARLWAEKLGGSGIAVDSMHPGWADTPGIAGSLPRFRTLTRPLLRTPEQGADTIVWLAATRHSGNLQDNGRFWHDRAPRPEHYLVSTVETALDRTTLWEACQKLTALPDDPPATQSTTEPPQT